MADEIKHFYARLPEGIKRILRPILRTYWYFSFLLVAPSFFRRLHAEHDKPIDLNLFEWKIYSEQGEDGVLLAIFDRIGTTNAFCVDFGAGDGITCNTGFLLKHRGWTGLQMDVLTIGAPRVKTERINAENIEILFESYQVPSEFDLLSIDIDFNDYWVWKAISHYSPRVVIVEYNPSFSYTESVAIAYDPMGYGDGSSYFSASLQAYIKLGEEKGYTLVACTSRGANSFFIRNDLVKDNFTRKPVSSMYAPTPYRPSSSNKTMIPV